MADSTRRRPTTAGASSASPAALTAWLASSQSVPEKAWQEWTESGVALLPLGSRFDAIRLPEALVCAAVGATVPREVAAHLSCLIEGPVIYDGRTLGGSYYVLTEPGRARTWKHQDVTPRLSHGTYLGVPRLGRTGPPGTYWVRPPRFEGDLCESTAVAAVVRLGRGEDETKRAAPGSLPIPSVRRREELIYQSYLAHLDSCSPCHAETGSCVDGERMRRALRAVRTAGRGGRENGSRTSERPDPHDPVR
ncbi:hypothetical protein [Streptomyces sp. NPDC047123]|uniref:hypothetical protein n=1 Tax=Streptomyces sp. NPDC047123 TaxID=3155622 RepID=UPI00340771A1